MTPTARWRNSRWHGCCSRGEHVIPIPGTTRIEHLEEDLSAADVHINAEMLARVDMLVNERTVAGARYPDSTLPEIDTERF